MIAALADILVKWQGSASEILMILPCHRVFTNRRQPLAVAVLVDKTGDPQI
jgi:hypothetical protein